MAGLIPAQERFTDPTGTVRIAEFIAALSRFPTGHLLDLGAGHGLFSRVAADLGWRVTAVDVRDVRFPEDPRVRWVTSDIRDFTGYEDVSVVACLGLWYHLSLADQLALLRRIAPRPLVLDTHVARDQAGEHPVHGLRLSPILDEGGFAGRLYSEGDLQHEPTASWGNDTSFWPTVPSLQRQLEEVGYDAIERLLPGVAPDREYFLARVLDSKVRTQIDEVLPRYNRLKDPVDAEPVATGPAPWTARRVVAGARRRLRGR